MMPDAKGLAVEWSDFQRVFQPEKIQRKTRAWTSIKSLAFFKIPDFGNFIPIYFFWYFERFYDVFKVYLKGF